MIFGFMRKTTHDQIVEKLESRINYLETRTLHLESVIDGKLTKPVEKSVQTTGTVKPNYVRVESTTKHPKVRLSVLETVLPKATFEMKGSAIRVKFNGKVARVRVAQPTFRKNSEKTYAFLNIVPGDICIALNEDQSLRSVFVAKRDMITKGERIFVVRDSQRDLEAIQNTSLVLRNFK